MTQSVWPRRRGAVGVSQKEEQTDHEAREPLRLLADDAVFTPDEREVDIGEDTR